MATTVNIFTLFVAHDFVTLGKPLDIFGAPYVHTTEGKSALRTQTEQNYPQLCTYISLESTALSTYSHPSAGSCVPQNVHAMLTEECTNS